MAGSIQVIHVDDDSDFLDMAATFLQREDDRLAVETVTTPESVLTRLNEQSYDCIISDYEMPQMNGVELLEAIRESYPNLPFILFTGKGSEEVASEAIASGVTDYVQKGSTEVYELLANRVTNAVDRLSYREKIKKLHNVAVDLESLEGLDAVCQRTIDAAESLLDFNSASIGVYDPDDEMIAVIAASESNPFEVPNRFPAQDTLANRTRRKQETIIIDDTNQIDQIRGNVSKSIISIPLNDRVIFQVGSNSTDAFSEEDIELTELLAAHTAEVIDRNDREEELKFERDRFQSLFETLPEPAILVSGESHLDATISQVNAAFENVFGYDETDVINRPINDLIVPNDRLDEAERIDQQIVEGTHSPQEVRRETADGELRDFLLLTTTFEKFGGIAQTFVIYADITNRKESQRKLQREKERLENFASIVSHDLRNPLRVAEGQLELAQEVCENGRDHLDAVKHAHTRMSELIDDILTLARQGQTVTKFEEVDLESLTEECCRTIETQSAIINTACSRMVAGDEERLQQLLENLIRNAVVHGGEEVSIEIGDFSKGFYVADDGPGIPPTERDDIFEPGYSTADNGTGLGLAIVNQITEAHGWDIHITKSAAGGARFEITGVEFPGE